MKNTMTFVTKLLMKLNIKFYLTKTTIHIKYNNIDSFGT